MKKENERLRINSHSCKRKKQEYVVSQDSKKENVSICHKKRCLDTMLT